MRVPAVHFKGENTCVWRVWGFVCSPNIRFFCYDTNSFVDFVLLCLKIVEKKNSNLELDERMSEQQEQQGDEQQVGAEVGEEYFTIARDMLMRECCRPQHELEHFRYPMNSGFSHVIHINTNGNANILSDLPGKKKIFKHLFLQNKFVKQNIVNYYRNMGFTWCDIVCLNRTAWKIFLW